MALLDPSHRYDALKAPFRGHALNDLLVRAGGKWEFQGSFSFETEEQYHQLKFVDTTASEEEKEIDRWTGEGRNVYTYEQVQNELPTWAEVEAEHLDNLAEYDAYASKRARVYPDIKNQLDMLYKDIHNGLLGEDAKASSFYTTIKAVKDANP